MIMGISIGIGFTAIILAGIYFGSKLMGRLCIPKEDDE